jgi:hypothetical protein
VTSCPFGRGGSRRRGCSEGRWGLNLKESLALDGQIEGIAGLLNRALRHAQPVAAQQAVVVHRLAQLRVQGVGPQQHGAEVLALGPVAGSLRIGQIGGRRIQGLGSRHQPGHRRIISAVHRSPPPARLRCR